MVFNSKELLLTFALEPDRMLKLRSQVVTSKSHLYQSKPSLILGITFLQV